MKRLWVVTMGLALSVQALANLNLKKKTMAEYLEEVDLQWSYLQNAINTKNCYQDKERFMACMEGISSLSESLKTPLRLVSADRVKLNPKLGAIKEDLGPVKAVQWKAPDQKASLADVVKQQRQEQLQSQNDWFKVFVDMQAAKKQTVDINLLLAWAKKAVETAKLHHRAVHVARAVNVYLNVLHDPHTAVLPLQYLLDERKNSATRTYFGIGAYMQTVGDKMIISRPIEGGPADKAGLRPNDEVTHVDGVSVAGKKMEDAIKLIKGDRGTEVKLTIRRGQKSIEVTLVRDEIKLTNVSARLSADKNWGYVRLATFMEDTSCSDLHKAIHKEFETKTGWKVKGLILDLRNNGGGLIGESICVADEFLDPGKLVVEIRPTSGIGRVTRYRTVRRHKVELPLIVLTNAYSASASELVAGALKDLGRAWVVGTTTFGKGSVQRLMGDPWGNGKMVRKQTTARFYLPGATGIRWTNQGVGVPADFEAYSKPNPTQEEMFALRESDRYRSLPPLGPGYKSIRGKQVKHLKDCIEQNGVAKKRYAQEEKLGLPDYARYYAEDLLTCMNP